MSEAKQTTLFSDEQMQRLILAYLYSRADEAVPTDDTKAYLNACAEAVFLGESIKLAADGALNVQWDATTGDFSFCINEAGMERARAIDAHHD